MAVRLNYLTRGRVPQLPEPALAEISPELAKHLRAQAVWMQEDERRVRRAARELDSNPVMTVARITAGQSLTANTLATVQFNSTIVDTHGWWNASTYAYTPQEPGFYRANWCIDFHDTAAIAAATYAYAQLNVGAGTPYRFLQYGNGAALDIMVNGGAVVECDGSATALSISGLIFAGTAPTIYEESASYRSWLSIDYIGRRFVSP